MNFIKILFWTGILTIFYAYAGYGILMYLLVFFKRLFTKAKPLPAESFEPEVSLVVPCYNEADILEEKLNNCFELDYPAEKLKIIFITDGSTDTSTEVLRKYSDRITVLHDHVRAGKSAAENRAMRHVTTPYVIFCDANTTLNREAIREIVKHYLDPAVGAVSGEKRIRQRAEETASGAGEGIYWKYESFLKRMDSELHTLVGAAGELVSFRTDLYTDLETDTILDDFVQSLRIAEQGYRVVYEPQAFAMENPSFSVAEELKRKIRICAGGWQAMVRLKSLLNPLKNGWLSFEYISHRVLRWSLAPLFLFLLVPLNLLLHIHEGGFYTLALASQLLFYPLVMAGWYLENRQIRVKVLFVPFYFFMMNFAVLLGFKRFVKGNQSAAWERSKRLSLEGEKVQ